MESLKARIKVEREGAELQRARSDVRSRMKCSGSAKALPSTWVMRKCERKLSCCWTTAQESE
eukprot:3730628-Pleurochrysis_carterae.AAC.2